jgi:outer membrane receptor protein involved in Fe transport
VILTLTFAGGQWANGQSTTQPAAPPPMPSPSAPPTPTLQPLPPMPSLEIPASQPAATGIPALQPPAITAAAQIPASQPTAELPPPAPVTHLHPVVVSSPSFISGQAQIAPSLGAVANVMGPQQIEAIPQGENAPFQQALVRFPGVVMDSYGQEHVRGEHGDLTYRVNGVLLPEGLNGFGQELDTHLIQSVTLMDGALPAQFGFRTAGIIDVTTKSGDTLQNNELSLYGGSNDTFEPSFVYGGTEDNWDYFFTGSYKHDDLGIENPADTPRAIHDDTDQQRLFGYLSTQLDPTSKFSIIFNMSDADFQIPDTAGLPRQFILSGVPYANSSNVDENQNEQDYYGVLSYQHTAGDISFQASAYSRYGQIHFTPDPVGDLIFQGVAGEVYNNFLTDGVQVDASDPISDSHTLRAGLVLDNTAEVLNTQTSVFSVDPVTGDQTSDTSFDISDNTTNDANEGGIYLQDEWKLTKTLTTNYGLRADFFAANFDRMEQLSPRANLVWQATRDTTAHIGYSRYFAPPPIQDIPSSTLAKFDDTTNGPASPDDDPPRVETSDYFDTGVRQQITPEWEASLDGYYKYSHNLLDLGQFGDAVILSPYNYRVGSVHGAEISTQYKSGGFSTYGNFAYVKTAAEDIVSQQFQFATDELDYIDSHDIKLDHESELTASAGVSYNWKNDMVYADFLYGSGLRAGFANLQKEPVYYPINVGYEHQFRPDGSTKDVVKLRFDVINVFDEDYQLRNGTGLGVNAPQYGQRRTFLVGMSYDF